MAIKEKNAREMWCPFTNTTYCRGWACMAWRWERKTGTDKSPLLSAAVRQHGAKTEDNLGHCVLLKEK